MFFQLYKVGSAHEDSIWPLRTTGVPQTGLIQGRIWDNVNAPQWLGRRLIDSKPRPRGDDCSSTSIKRQATSDKHPSASNGWTMDGSHGYQDSNAVTVLWGVAPAARTRSGAAINHRHVAGPRPVPTGSPYRPRGRSRKVTGAAD